MNSARRLVSSAASTNAPFNQPRLRNMLHLWFCLGLLAVICLPAARGASLWIGYLPYWLVAAPLLSMAVLDRQNLRQFVIQRASLGLRRGKRRFGLARNRRVKTRPARRQNTLRASLAALIGGRS